MNNKIFGIGLHKTGTTTLLECLRILGLDICPKIKGYAIRQVTATLDFVPCLHLACQHQSFVDSPWCYKNVYRVLDVSFPGALFILTTRDPYSWFQSLSRWVKRNESAEWIDMLATIGTEFDVNNEQKMIEAYVSHCMEVQKYFSSQWALGKLLTVNWETGDRWNRLCEFLDIQAPHEGFGFPYMERYDQNTDSYTSYSPVN